MKRTVLVMSGMFVALSLVGCSYGTLFSQAGPPTRTVFVEATEGESAEQVGSVADGQPKSADPVADQAPANAADTVEKCRSIGGKTTFTLTPATSCGFANAVANAVLEAGEQSGGFSVTAESPVTWKKYSMACANAGTETTCEGGDNAKVAIRPAAPGDTKASGSQLTFEGTIMMKQPSEVTNGNPMPYQLRPGSEYAMLVFDSPQPVAGMKADRSRTVNNTVDMIGLGQKELTQYGSRDSTTQWRQHAGQRVRFHIDPDSMTYQTDASLPMAKPRLSPQANYSVEVVG